MPNNAKKAVYKEKEFEMYEIWKSVPAYFRGMKKEQLLPLGFSDPMIQKIISIKSQTEFAKIFRIKDLGTLTDWNKKIEKNNSPKKSFNQIFNDQIDVVNNTITRQPDILLKNKIREQRKLISQLKKENILYKKQFKKSSRQKPNDSPNSVTQIESKTQPIEPQDEYGILKSFKKFVKMWQR